MQASGQPWRYQGLTQFELPSLMEAGEDIARQLTWAPSKRFNVMRCFTQHRHADGGFNYNALSTLEALAKRAASVGVWLELVVQAFPEPDLGVIRKHGQGIYDLARAFDNILVEDTNEPGLHGYDSSPLADLDKRGVTFSTGDYDFAIANDPSGRLFTDENGTRPRLISTLPRVGRYVTVHGERGPEWPRKTKDMIAWRDGWNDDGGEFSGTHVPCVADEPIGADETEQPGRRSASGDDFEASWALACLFSAGQTFHCQIGLDGRVPAAGSVQDRIADRVAAVLDFIPASAYPCVYYHGADEHAAEDKFGALRVYRGGNYVVLVRPTKNLNQLDDHFRPKRRLGNQVLEV